MIPSKEATTKNLVPEQEKYLFPCTVVQRICWFLDRMSPGTPIHNIAVRFLLQGQLNVDLLEEAFREVIRRHEVLRTRFIAEDGEPQQFVEPEMPFSLPVFDLRSTASEARKAQAEGLAAEEARIGFDIEKGSLLRGKLVQMAEEESMLLVTMHHMISDGWSVGTLTDEVGDIYETLVQGQLCRLPPLPLQYGDYACWQRDWIASGELDKELDVLKERLDGFAPLVIPTDLERPLTSTTKGEIRSIVLPRALTDKLKQFSTEVGCTLFVTMLSAFLLLMRRESGQQEIVIRTQIAGRDRVELETLIGWFVNSVIIRTVVRDEQTFHAFVTEVQQAVLDALELRDVPFERVMDVVHPSQTAMPHHPPFQVNFIFQRDLVQPWTRGGVRMTPIPSKATGTFVDLNFFLVERADGWRASVDVSLDVFRVETGDLFLQRFQNLLQAAAQNPEGLVSEILPPPRGAGSTSARPRDRRKIHIAPRNSLETSVATIWEEVLENSPISVDANFFDVGGHSLRAVQVLSLIQSRLGHRIPLNRIFEAPTIERMAALLSSEEQSLVVTPIRKQGSKPPLYLLHGVGGTVVGLWELIRRLGPDQPVYGVQSREPRPDEAALARIEDMAAHYIAEIKKVQPMGPYCFLGYSFGGLVAFEMAQQLHAAGEEVGLLAMLDTRQVSHFKSTTPLREIAARGKKVGFLHLRRIVKGPDRLAYLNNRAISKSLRIIYEAYRRIGRPIPGRLVIGENLNWFAARNYRPKEYTGSIVLFRATADAPPSPADRLLGWDGMAQSGIEVMDIPSTHAAMTKEPGVSILAEQLHMCLNRIKS